MNEENKTLANAALETGDVIQQTYDTFSFNGKNGKLYSCAGPSDKVSENSDADALKPDADALKPDADALKPDADDQNAVKPNPGAGGGKRKSRKRPKKSKKGGKRVSRKLRGGSKLSLKGGKKSRKSRGKK